ncbi:MAG TPA: ferredoxin [Mycobacteriales bacterium]|jgi:ferredoxin|nr:ferredoxin [Mycobacteriales bacterium]
MRVIHDPDQCANLGMCEGIEPGVFEIGDDGTLVLLQPSPPESLRASVEAAAASCPTGALRIED